MRVDEPFAEMGGLLTVNEFCKWASIGRTKLYAEMNAGRLMAKKFGSRTLIPRTEAKKWMEQLPTRH
ncbi:excisionase family DNA binding protein [Acidovorax delafieldii]|uniref:Excisionase family DNA binding protein n=2 Tax=Acidovorax delafieldii TaxID=47920 RepID=A0A561XI44_ACIDE|nr:excisionase family DNA binding protein [Acidovorax delafieldii]